MKNYVQRWIKTSDETFFTIQIIKWVFLFYEQNYIILSHAITVYVCVTFWIYANKKVIKFYFFVFGFFYEKQRKKVHDTVVIFTYAKDN